MMKNTTFKKIVCSLLFVSLIFASVVALTFVVRPKLDTKIYGYKHATATQIMGESKNTVDVLVLGDSLAFRSTSPLRIWQNSGITSYVCATPSQKLFYSEEFLRLAFDTQSPKAVLLETNTIFRSFTVSEIMTNELETGLGFFRFHNRWKTLKEEDFSSALSVDYSQQNIQKGYKFTRRARKTDTTGYMSYSTDREPIESLNLRYVKRINDYCKKHGAKLILYSAPSVENYSYPRHNALKSLSNELECEYIDMNLLRKEIPINWKYNSMDKGDHLNYSGAIKVSDYLAGYLTELKLFDDKRQNASYSCWNTAVEELKNEKNIRDDETEQKIAKKFSIRAEKRQIEKQKKKLQGISGATDIGIPTNANGELASLTSTTAQSTAAVTQTTCESTEQTTSALKSKKKNKKSTQNKQPKTKTE